MYIVGSTGSGKTHTLLKILEKELKHQFTYIFLLCPTFGNNKTYQEWKYKDDPKFFVISVDQEMIESFLEFIAVNYENTNSLVILDDCAACQTVKDRTSPLVNFAFSGRHAGFSTVVISQQFKAITPCFRTNVQHVLVFYTLDESDRENVIKFCLNGFSKEEKNEIFRTLKKERYSYLHVSRDGKHLVTNKDVVSYE